MKNQKFPTYCLVASWVFGVIGFYLGLKIEPLIFSRFGSIVVLLAVMSEYALLKGELSKLYQNLKGEGGTHWDYEGIPDLSPSKWHSTQAMISHITIVIGTFVWGFGDLCIPKT